MLTDEDADELLNTYNISSKDIVDKHAPKQVKVITLSPYELLYNDNIKEERRCGWKYKKSNLENDRHNYIVKYKSIYMLLKILKQHITNIELTNI